MKPFDLHEPTTVNEAVSLVAGLGDAAKLYAGGTELLLAMKTGVLQYDHLINVKTVAGLNDLTYDAATGALRIGAAVTHRAIESSAEVQQHFPLLAGVERRVANVRVRNVGTLAGNLCFAEPHSDPGAALLLFEAQAEVAGSSGVRRVSIEELQTGPYETGLQPDELLTVVSVPRLPDGMRGAYLKFGYHHRPTLGMGVAVKLDGQGTNGNGTIEDIRIALGSVSPKPLRLREAEVMLRGASLGDLFRDGSAGPLLTEATEAAARVADPVDDMHGSAEYKRHLTRVFLGRALRAAVEAPEDGA